MCLQQPLKVLIRPISDLVFAGILLILIPFPENLFCFRSNLNTTTGMSPANCLSLGPLV